MTGRCNEAVQENGSLRNIMLKQRTHAYTTQTYTHNIYTYMTVCCNEAFQESDAQEEAGKIFSKICSLLNFVYIISFELIFFDFLPGGCSQASGLSCVGHLILLAQRESRLNEIRVRHEARDSACAREDMSGRRRRRDY